MKIPHCPNLPPKGQALTWKDAMKCLEDDPVQVIHLSEDDLTFVDATARANGVGRERLIDLIGKAIRSRNGCKVLIFDDRRPFHFL